MIVLTLPYPISANKYWRSRILKVKGVPMVSVYVSADAKEYKAKVQQIARAAGITKPLTGRMRLHAELYPHRPLDWKTRMRKLGETWDDSVQCIDLGNAEKVTSDALQGTVFADDCMFRRIVLERMEPDANGARLVVRIEPVVPAARQADLLGAAA